MKRVNLKKLKDALNKLPDNSLEHFYLMHKMSIEDPDISMGLVFFDEEEECEKYIELFDTPEFKIIEQFAKAVEEDCKKVIICTIDEDKADDYADDCE